MFSFKKCVPQILSCAVVCLSLFVVSAWGQTPLGQMDGFWRYRPLGDRWMVDGQGLYEIPSYFSQHDFPYVRRTDSSGVPYPEEVPFADHLIMVRMMGGWSLDWTGGETNDFNTSNEEADFVYRNSDGSLGFRQSLVEPRFKPYVDAGYTDFTVVLDNTPWSLSASPATGNYGNTAPPEYPSHFYWGVKNMIKEIRTLYGGAFAENLRFRMGTEYQGTNRFTGTHAQYERLYDFASDAVRDELSNVDFFPFNLAGPAVANILNNHNVSYIELAEHCVSGSNPTGGIGAPFTNFPMSLYFNPIFVDGELRRASPAEYADTRIQSWDEIAIRQPSLNFRRSVHEFGVLNDENNLKTDEPGARGAAMRFETIIRLMEGGLDEIAFWDSLDRIPASGNVPQYLLMTGEAWLLTLFEFYKGADAYSLPVTAPTLEGSTYRALLMMTPNETAILISAFNVDRFIDETVNCTITVPAGLIANTGNLVASTLTYDTGTALYDWLREEFSDDNVLLGDYATASKTPAQVKIMAGTNGQAWIRNHWASVETHMINSLILQPYTESAVVLGNGDVVLSFPMTTPSLRLIVLE